MALKFLYPFWGSEHRNPQEFIGFVKSNGFHGIEINIPKNAIFETSFYETLQQAREENQELNNLYDQPEYKTVQEQLHKRLKELRIQYQDNSDNLNQEWIAKDIERLRSLGWY